MSEISGFSTNLSIQNLFGYVSYAGDRFIIGRFIGTTELGYYGLANRLMRYPVQTSAQTYRDVVFPSLARMQSDHKAMATMYERSVSGIAFLLFPLCATVAAVAQPLVAVMLGPKWAPTADIIGLIAITSALQAVSATTGSLYNARGRADLSLRWQIGSSIFLVLAYSIGSAYGVVGVAWGYLIGTALLTPLAFWIPLRLIGASLFQVTRGALAAGAAAVVAALAANGVVRLLVEQESSDFVQLVVGCVVSLAVFALYAAAFRPRAARDLLAMLRR
jgi:PST family polysaccharide transporter